MDTTQECRLLDEQTADLLAWHDDVRESHEDDFEAAKELATRLGAHVTETEDGEVAAAVGFWTPDLVEAGVPETDVYLEVLTSTTPVDLAAEETTAEFQRERVPLRRKGEFHWGVVAGMRAGTRDVVGSLYQLVYEDDDGWHAVPDPLAYSVPFGAFAPAEFYDMERLDDERPDRAYFETLGTDEERVETTEHDGLPRVSPANSMLEIHPGTATESGSLKGLAERYEDIGGKLHRGDELDPADRNFVGYDGIQLMPVEPITENPDIHDFWRPAGDSSSSNDPTPVGTADDDPETVEVTVSHPDMINWGYDIVVSAFSAVNPAILETGRPDELVDFIAACHAMPDPIRVVFDVALGHADNGGLNTLPSPFFEGPGMYGQHLNYPHPTVRAMLLEMQRRKMDFGADGIRVDGAQDFTYYDPGLDENVHDDAFLAEMDAVTQEVAGTEYRPWMVFEDGRPWPREDWELAATYRSLIEQHPHSFQWSPITFAHNTPALLTFWATKWWRVREVLDFGGHWLTGVANHDTIRRGTQIDPHVEFNQSPVNPYLGESLPNVLDEAYDNAAAAMFFYCASPGVPMDFVHANARAPWGFVRDTDETWNVKVVSDESSFVDWQLRPEEFHDPEHFTRVKGLGFEDEEQLGTFMNALSAAVDATDYDLDAMAEMLSALDTPFTGEDGTGGPTATDLEAFAYAWMQDVHDFANLAHWADDQDEERTAFRLRTRRFRHERPWLREDVSESEFFTYRHPTDGTVLYFGLRESPDGDEQLLFAANMEGVPVDVSPESLDVPDLPRDGWTVALAAPSLDVEAGEETTADDPVTLTNATAVVWTREP
ncbi:glucosylglycerol hydrolase [Halobium salinum]|uniref:Glucosylglycerol hydrolase n=1 Tax=Halobium salinum TaxID=1364940 RepID=A0ABD5PEP6_9EURY|nr:glucosylglycerol hydrolase [Halobium salinum]